MAHHHERFDGTGYPAALSGREIPLAARIVAVAAAFQALLNDRPYRAAQTVADALEEMRRCTGTQFDPDVVAALERVTGRMERIDLGPQVGGGLLLDHHADSDGQHRGTAESGQ